MNSNAGVFLKTTLGDRCCNYSQGWKGIGKTEKMSTQESTGAFREKEIRFMLFSSKPASYVQTAL